MSVSLRRRPNKYKNLKPSEQKGTSGQRRVIREFNKQRAEELVAAEMKRHDAEQIADSER